MQKKVNNDQERLRGVVTWLKSKGVIKRDNELAERMGYSPATLSEYLNGKKPVTPNFIKTLEDTFNLDFSKIQVSKPDADIVNTDVKIIKLLKLIAAKVGIPESEVKKALK